MSAWLCIYFLPSASALGLRATNAFLNHPQVPVTVDEHGILRPLPLDYEERKTEHILQPFIEAAPIACEYAGSELPDCYDAVPVESMKHMWLRRVVMMFLILSVALWSISNEFFVNTLTTIIAKDFGEQALEVLHSLFSEVTVLGFIALLTGVLIRSGELHLFSDWIFGSGPILDHEHKDMRDNWHQTSVEDEGTGDIRDGRHLSELTVLFEDIHIILFLIMLALIGVAALNLRQVSQITHEWSHAEDLVTKHGEEDALHIINSLEQSPQIGWYRRAKMGRYLKYLSYRHEFMWPSYMNRPENVDPETFPFSDYLRYCAGTAVVENVEVPIWMYAVNSFIALLLRPFFGFTGVNVVVFLVIVPYILCGGFGLLIWHLRRIEYWVAVDLAAGNEDASWVDGTQPRGRRFAVDAAKVPRTVQKAEPASLARSVRHVVNATLTPTPFERLFMFQRRGRRFLAVASRMLLFWVAVYMAVLVENIRVFPYTWARYCWCIPLIAAPLVYLLFELYPLATFLRILVTTTEYSPSRAAINHIGQSQVNYIHDAKVELVKVLKREMMRELVEDAATNGCERLAGEYHQLPERTRHFVDKSYYTFDSDNSGYLDAQELVRCLNSLKLTGDVDLTEQEIRTTDYVRAPHEEWFQILAKDRQRITHAQFKVLIWALISAGDLVLEEGEVLVALKRVHPEKTTVSASSFFRIAVALTKLPPTWPILGKDLLREAFLLRHDTNAEMPVDYEAPIEDAARLVINIDHELCTQRGVD